MAWLTAREWTKRVTSRLHRHAEPEPDPFETLRVQTRLGYLSGKIRSIETMPHVYARAHRLMALEAAYDDLLDEACRLAGVPEPGAAHPEDRRWQEEQELAARGWTW